MCTFNVILFLFFVGYVKSLEGLENLNKVKYQYEVEKWLNNVLQDLSRFNSMAAHLTWKLSTSPDEKTSKQATQLGRVRNRWKNKVCASAIERSLLTDEQQRKIYLLCRGPKFTDDKALEFLELLGSLSEEYNSKVCLNQQGSPDFHNKNLSVKTPSSFPKVGQCLYGEPDLERTMRRLDLSADDLNWIWKNWHDSVGTRIKGIFAMSVDYQNEAARNNGYCDIGEAWREELEIPNLEKVVETLYREIQPLYVQLHAVIRHKLYQKYGPKIIDPKGPLPAHLLGNMWGQDWSTLVKLFPLPTYKKIDLDRQLKEKNTTVKDMVLQAEDFYTSLRLPKMTDTFWKYSVFEDSGNTTTCHGTAANLYKKSDYRMLMCAKPTMEDFYIIHHEMGHIEYYMAYEEQPSIFQDGTNTAFHESIGDAIMHGVMTPQHLHRLGLLTDTQLADPGTETYLLLLQALSKIPEIPYSLVLDKYRWDIFRGTIPYAEWNKYFWDLNKKYRGIVPPEDRFTKKEYFDAGAKFHIPDNTPYIRYFLSSILQMQIFRGCCELALYGKLSDGENNYVPIHRCDIYGSRNAGKKLLSVMEQGASIHWKQALMMIAGTDQISTKPILEYYEPIYKWLENYIQENNVHVGW